MELTPKNIEDLYIFTRKHYVEHYDVQTELVDHLANDIEQIWQETPTLTFEESRDKAFKKFGVFGFMNVVEKKQSQMQKKYFKIILGFVKEWFNLPKLVVAVFLIYIFYQLQKLPSAYYFFAGSYFLLFIIELILMILKRKKFNKKVKETGRCWMFEEIIETQGYGNLIFFTYCLYAFTFFENLSSLSFYLKVLNAVFFTLALIVGYITLYMIPKKSEFFLKEYYPEYKLTSS